LVAKAKALPQAIASAAEGQISPQAAAFVAKAKSAAASKPAKGASKPQSAIPIKDETISILIHVGVGGFIVSAALQGAGLYALRPHILNNLLEVEPAKKKFFVNNVEKEVDHLFLDKIKMATIKGNPHLMTQSTVGNMFDLTDDVQRTILRSSRMMDHTGWSWAIFPSTHEGTNEQRHNELKKGLKQMIDFIKETTYPDTFPNARRLLRYSVIEETMDVFEDHESLVRELPAMAEAMRFMRQQHHTPTKASVL
jgi:hypothetical protein